MVQVQGGDVHPGARRAVRDPDPVSYTHLIASSNVLPGIGAQLLETQRNPLPLAVELQDAHVDFFTDLDHFGGVLDAFPSHVGDVQQSIDAAEIDERAVIGEVLDHALDGGALLEVCLLYTSRCV